MKNKALLIHHDYYDIVRLLTVEESGILFKAMLEYDINGTEPEFEDRALTLLFAQFKKSLDSNRKHYEQTCKRKSENAKKRWKKEEGEISEEEDADAQKLMQNDADAYKRKANENANGNVNVKEKEGASDALKKQEAENADTQTHKMPCGEFKNVLLSEEELTRLKEKTPDALRRIESLSAYIKSSGKVYSDHYAQLLNWRLFENSSCGAPKRDDKSCKPPGERREPTFDVSEFTKKALDIRYVPPKDD